MPNEAVEPGDRGSPCWRSSSSSARAWPSRGRGPGRHPARRPPPLEHPEWSVARRWNEALLDAIRRALPAPTVHARNLYHTSAAMWDAWAAYDSTASGVFVKEKQTASNVGRRAQRGDQLRRLPDPVVALHQVGRRRGVAQRVRDVMDSLCYPLDVTTTEGDSPAALGNRIAEAVIAFGMTDGSNQANGYAPPDYKPVNAPLVVADSGTTMIDPNRWQPLQLAHMISQNGDPDRERRPAVRRAALGPRHRVRPAERRRGRHADRPGSRRRCSATRPPTRPTRTRPSR